MFAEVEIFLVELLLEEISSLQLPGACISLFLVVVDSLSDSVDFERLFIYHGAVEAFDEADRYLH